MTKQRQFQILIGRVFEYLYNQADSILKESNPCRHTFKKGKHNCVGQDDELGGMSLGRRQAACCCYGCNFFNNGCTAEKPLTCKTWLCPTAKLTNSGATKKLNEIANLTDYFGLYTVRGDKQQSLEQAETSYCRVFYRKGIELDLYSVGLKTLKNDIKEFNLPINLDF